MKPLALAAAPLHAAALLSGAKSFAGNPIIGSPTLNRRGLHVRRLALADAMAERRRRSLAHLVSAEDRAAFDRDGFVMRRNALPPEDFRRLLSEIDRPLEAREMRQGAAVTRFIELPSDVLRAAPTLAGFVRGPLFLGLLRYAASTAGEATVYLHAVLTDPQKGKPDPQTVWHSDTFHATAKAWLFLNDVEEADGPFRYAPGSHRPTPERLEWELEQSVSASTAKNALHARGSFRATEDEIRAMGYREPVSFAVPANTLIVADTHGFHARAHSARPSVRTAIYGSVRRNPFLPWAGLDPLSLPGLRGRKAEIFGAWLDMRQRRTGKNPQPKVGQVRLADPTPRV